ncbi:MAG: MBL fold metallo-hydrolase, partial [bacterium]
DGGGQVITNPVTATVPRRRALLALTMVLVVPAVDRVLISSLSATAQEAAHAGETAVRVLPVRDNIYMLAGAGGNITMQLGADGVLLVDAGRAAMADQVLAAIRAISTASVRQLILTHAHPDAAGGVAKLRQAGNAVLGGNFADRPGAAILAHESTALKLSEGPSAGTPTDSYFVARHDFYFNGEPVEILHQPKAHTAGDSLVFFRKSDVLSVGDILDMTAYPMIDEAAGGSINGVIAGLNRILEITVPATLQEGGTIVIPGKGRQCDEGDVNWYRYMVTVIRDRVQDMVSKGMTVQQVKAARPTLEYDARFGSTSGAWTTDMFVEAVYRGVGGTQRKPEIK